MALDLAGFQTAAFVGNPMLLGDYGYGRGFGTYEIVWGDHGRPHLASARALVDRALEYLSVNRAASSFLYVHLMDTHTPYAPAPPHRDRFVGTGGPRAPTPARVVEEVPWLPLAPSMQSLFGEGLTPDQFDPDRYDEAIATVDAEFGRLVDGVAALGLGERTLFVLTADHGEALGLEDDGRRIHGHALFEELVHVPLVVVAPWLAGGRRVAEVVGLIDVAPTLLDLVGGAIPDTFLGQSLFVSPPPLEPPAALVERLEPRWNRTVVFGAGRHGVAEWGFREDRWKLLLDPQRVRLFDVVADPKETRDVAAAHPDVVGYLAQRLGQASPSLRGVAAPVVDPSADGPRLKDALRALGYMEP
jgi:arylsulfatase A-like enzyme